ncbi:MAG: protocatechuate 4,5-dioxygenase subunit alpha [Acidimicrobiia bacterium]
MARAHREYDDIPGTYVCDAAHHRKGYHLNMFGMSLNDPKNRAKFGEDEEAYLDQWELTPEQRQAVLDREWLEMLRLGGNIYSTFKIAAFDGLKMQDVGAAMSGVTEEEFTQMMIDGGRSPDG